MGRGCSYPQLAVAVGERVHLIGAMSVETAARCLNSRDIEGVVIGDGFGPRVLDAMLAVLAGDARFRDLPIGVLAGSAACDERLPNLIHAADPEMLVDRLMPFVRLQAFDRHLTRVLKSLETEGILDPATGLLAGAAFWCDLDRAVRDAGSSGGCLSVARFSFDDMDDVRAHLDAARLFSRLVRNIDFACQEQDGSILAAFTETDLRSAHVVARRIAASAQAEHACLGSRAGCGQAHGDAGGAQAQRQSEHAGGARGHLIPRSHWAERARARRTPSHERQRAQVVGRPANAGFVQPLPQHQDTPPRTRPDAQPPLTIDMVSDVVCPWCYIGKRLLETAIASRPEIPVEPRFRPYFLKSWVPRAGITREDYLIAKFGSVER